MNYQPTTAARVSGLGRRHGLPRTVAVRCTIESIGEVRMPRVNRIHLGDVVYDVDYRVADIVYLVTNDRANRGQVIGYSVMPGCVMYNVCWGPDATMKSHYDFELSPHPYRVGMAGDDPHDPHVGSVEPPSRG
jgi:hypothetical protein